MYKFELEPAQSEAIAAQTLMRDRAMVRFLQCKSELSTLDEKLHRLRAANDELRGGWFECWVLVLGARGGVRGSVRGVGSKGVKLVWVVDMSVRRQLVAG
jgi:hypothetical protein